MRDIIIYNKISSVLSNNKSQSSFKMTLVTEIKEKLIRLIIKKVVKTLSSYILNVIFDFT